VADPTPRMPLLPDYYAILQVHPRASEAVIKKAYRTLLLEGGQHPDRGGDQGRAAVLTEAYEVLSDPARRSDYDRWYHRRAPEASAPAAGDVPLVMICPACATKNRVRSQGVLAIARCSRCGQALSRLPRVAAAPLPARWMLLGGLGLVVSAAAAWWALTSGPLWADPVVQADRLARADRLVEARGLLDQALRLDPDNPRLHEKLGETFLLEQRYEEASLHFARAGRLSPENAHLLAREGRALLLLGRLRESEQAYRAALRLAPAHVPALSDLGHLLARQGRHSEAVACLERAVRLEPHADLADHLRLAGLYERLGQTRRAIEAWRVCLREGQGDPGVVTRARRALGRLGVAG